MDYLWKLDVVHTELWCSYQRQRLHQSFNMNMRCDVILFHLRDWKPLLRKCCSLVCATYTVVVASSSLECWHLVVHRCSILQTTTHHDYSPEFCDHIWMWAPCIDLVLDLRLCQLATLARPLKCLCFCNVPRCIFLWWTNLLFIDMHPSSDQVRCGCTC